MLGVRAGAMFVEALPKMIQGPNNVVVHSARGDVHDISNLVVTQVLLTPEREGLPLSVR